MAVLLQDAIAAAVNAGLIVTQPIDKAFSPNVPLGYVISQSPAAGLSVPPSTPVHFVVSLGPAPVIPNVTVPNVVGAVLLDAMTTLIRAGAGGAVYGGLNVANPVWLWNTNAIVLPLTWDSTLFTFDLTTVTFDETQYFPFAPSAAGVVVAQSIAAGASVPPETTVVLTVNAGAPTTSLPGAQVVVPLMV